MNGPKPVAGARPPLFDRLCDYEPSVPFEPRPFRTLDAEGLRASVETELDRLLNTRAPIAAEDLEMRERTAINYGIPDLTHYWPRDNDSTAELERLVEQTVTAFEPRLLSPRAKIIRPPDQRDAVIVEIAGSLAIGMVMEPVAFTLTANGLGPRAGGSEGTADADG